MALDSPLNVSGAWLSETALGATTSTPVTLNEDGERLDFRLAWSVQRLGGPVYRLIENVLTGGDP
jgi:hypothetical protein